MWMHVWVFYSIPLINMAFLPISCSIYFYNSVLELKIRDGYISGNSFTDQDCFGYAVFFFQMKLNAVLPRSVKNAIFMGILLNLWIDFRRMAIFFYYFCYTDPRAGEISLFSDTFYFFFQLTKKS